MTEDERKVTNLTEWSKARESRVAPEVGGVVTERSRDVDGTDVVLKPGTFTDKVVRLGRVAVNVTIALGAAGWRVSVWPPGAGLPSDVVLEVETDASTVPEVVRIEGVRSWALVDESATKVTAVVSRRGENVRLTAVRR